MTKPVNPRGEIVARGLADAVAAYDRGDIAGVTEALLGADLTPCAACVALAASVVKVMRLDGAPPGAPIELLAYAPPHATDAQREAAGVVGAMVAALSKGNAKGAHKAFHGGEAKDATVLAMMLDLTCALTRAVRARRDAVAPPEERMN